MRLSVVIVNYNVKFFLEQCLNSVLKATESIASEIFVVDNASSDNSLEYLRPRFPKVHFIANTDNVGFSKANNLAINQSSGEYVLLLNPDTFVGESVIRDCLELMDSDPKAGGVGVRMLGTDGSFAFESRRGFPSPITSFYKITGLCNLFPYSQRFGKYYLRYLDENKINNIDVISGAYMLLRREALDKCGLLDESFFMYGEDIDMSYRITLAGYKNYYVPSPIIHYKGESTKKDSFKYVYTFYDAMVIFFRKHFPYYSGAFSIMVKAFIYLRAFMALLRRSINKLISFLGFKHKTKEICFLVLGSEAVLRDMRVICKNNSLSGKHHYVLASEKTTQQGHLNLGLNLEEFTHVVYDTNAFSYSKVIALLAASTGQHKLELGTYSSGCKVLITSQQTYQ